MDLAALIILGLVCLTALAAMVVVSQQVLAHARQTVESLNAANDQTAAVIAEAHDRLMHMVGTTSYVSPRQTVAAVRAATEAAAELSGSDGYSAPKLYKSRDEEDAEWDEHLSEQDALEAEFAAAANEAAGVS